MSFCSTFVCYIGYAFLMVVLVIYNYILFNFVIVISLVIILCGFNINFVGKCSLNKIAFIFSG